MRNKFTAREKINAKSGVSIKNLEFIDGVAIFDCVAVDIANVTVDGKTTENAIFITTDGTAINTISSTVIESVGDIISLIESGDITTDEVITITVTERTSNAGRKFYMISI